MHSWPWSSIKKSYFERVEPIADALGFSQVDFAFATTTQADADD